MKSEELKKIQAPIKAKYRDKPESAMVTLKAKGRIGEGISCNVETGRALVAAGLHPASGGNGLLICSGNLLLESLVGCAGVTLSAVLTSMGIEMREGTVEVEGDLDFRGTLGVSKEVPVGFKSIRLSYILDCDTSPEQLQTLIKLTEKYCVVYQTLINGVKIETSLKEH
jgi:uncharacterized OsmC-like protein